MTGTRLTPDVELEGVSPEEAFAVLGDRTRLDIVRALWEAGALHEYDDLDRSASTITFSELRRRVDVDDNGRFNYHLTRLTPHFVRRADDGYRLSEAGRKIARTVVAISGPRSPDVSEEVNTNCPACGGAVRATYEDRWLRFACTECDGLFGDAAPDGTILDAPTPPAGVTGRSPDDALTRGLYRCMLDLTYMMQGICRECAGPVEGVVTACDDHDAGPGRSCETCGTPFVAWGELRCDRCRFAKRLPVELCVMGLPPVIAFLYTRDVNVLAPSLDEVVDLVRARVDVSVTDDPLRVAAAIDVGADGMTVVLDGTMGVVEVTD